MSILSDPNSLTMKTYRVKESVKQRYLLEGLGSCLLLCCILVVRPAIFNSTKLNVIFYLMVIVLVVLHLLRFKTCQLRVEDKEIYFYNGLTDMKHITLDQIAKVEFNPEIRIRIVMKRKDTVYRIPNVFSDEDTAEILRTIKKRRKTIVIDYIEKPTKMIEKSEN